MEEQGPTRWRAQSAHIKCLSSIASEIVAGVCVLSGTMHREGPAEMPLIQMSSVMAIGPLAALSFSPRLSLTINRKKNIIVTFGDGVTFVVVLHQVWKKHPVHQDFLGFYVVDSHRMSAQTHGLLGMECSSFRLFTWQRRKAM